MTVSRDPFYDIISGFFGGFFVAYYMLVTPHHMTLFFKEITMKNYFMK